MDAYIGRIQVPVHRGLISYGNEDYGPKLAQGLLSMGRPEDWIVDSGAHFFLSAYYKTHKLSPLGDIERHQRSLIGALDALMVDPRLGGVRPSFVVEMDLQELYGIAQVEAWRRDVWRPYALRTGLTVCYVWHPPDGPAGWRALLDDPHAKVIGLSGGRSTPNAGRRKMILEAYEARKWVHGFASFSSIREVPFTSVDSTSWCSGAVFGRALKFNPKKGKMGGYDVGRKALRDNRTATLGAMLAVGRGDIRPADGLGVPTTGLPALQRLYASAAAEYVKLESWVGAYWRGKGVDWNKQLQHTP